MKERNTKQKQIILEVLKNDKTHPTIKEIYNKVNKIDSNIGQATIYRNINKLVADGEILKIKIDNNLDRYDGNISNHLHFLCNKCLKIYDIFETNDSFINSIENKYNLKINNSEIYLEGICSSCKEKE